MSLDALEFEFELNVATELRVAAACLLCFWFQSDEHVLFWMLDSLTDVVLCLSPQGTGSQYLLKKFSNLPQSV